jgi:hypothetical protein
MSIRIHRGLVRSKVPNKRRLNVIWTARVVVEENVHNRWKNCRLSRGFCDGAIIIAMYNGEVATEEFE